MKGGKIKGMEKQTIIILLLLVLLVGAGGYIGYSQYKGIQGMYMQQGAAAGYQQAILDIANGVATCTQPVPLRIQNITINIVAVECLQRAAQQQQAAQQQGQGPGTRPTA